MYPALVLSRQVRQRDKKMIAMKEEAFFFYSQSPRNRRHAMLHHTMQGHRGKHQSKTSQQREGQTAGRSFYCSLHRKEWEKQGKQEIQTYDWIV